MSQKQHFEDNMEELKILFNKPDLPIQDFSTRIMNLIDEREYKTNLKPNVFKRTAFVLAIVGILCGFTYATTKWIELKDNNGNAVIEVRPTDSRILPAYQQALDEIGNKLSPEETATVWFGSKDDILNKKTDQVMHTSGAPNKYTDFSQFIKAIAAPFESSQFQPILSEDYQFKEASIYMDPAIGAGKKGNMIFDKASNGQELGYYTQKIIGNQPSSIVITYTNREDEVNYTSYFLRREDKILFDSSPSVDAKTVINDVDTYYYVDEDTQKRTLLWAKQENERTAHFVLSSTTASKSELLKIAKSILSD
ncbi:DUF4367 domain-containing protein [Paenibacillus sp. YPG26]|uniref:DUF4367 domain-containing protein n=1 Tax=Paenibacillus sp. YPG26 TaxID=2878915 RepID=UPI00203DF367|nr:DUF4367 domain-containing protein [Paenibacillus sp. YPG26]USB31809.1 DUF4367 domain-containing protein [Paenibacillus sp. YPG26]